MSVQLDRLYFSPRGSSGWATPSLRFGRVLTLVLGPNGSGKTPLLEGLAYALGNPVSLPSEIRTHCESIRLTLIEGSDQIQIERRISDGLYADVTERQHTAHFSDEKEFSAWIVERLGIPARTLTDKGGRPVPPYMSLLVPMFWIDQDLGWRDLYSPLSTHNFVKDQYSELARWLLGLPQKHRVIDASAFESAKKRLESIREQIAIKRATMEALQTEVGYDLGPSAREKLVERKAAIIAELQSRTSVLETLAQSHSALDEPLAEMTRERDSARFAVNAAERRLGELQRSGQELSAEVQILEMNEVAADAFRALCGSDSCQFFRRPEESYGRRLLYLKDQLKDFDSSSSLIVSEVEGLRASVLMAERRLDDALGEKKREVAATLAGQVVAAVDSLATDLSDVSLRLERTEVIAREGARFNALIDRGLKLEEEVSQLRPTRGAAADLSRLAAGRSTLQRFFEKWLEILRTQNIPRPISIDEDLRLHFGDERFSENSSSSGSTRTRIVLAFHAALLEASAKTDGHHPGFLVLDTPKQHELHSQDLAAFVRRFRTFAEDRPTPIQLVIAATEGDFAAENVAEEIWRPTMGTREEPRFFGPPTAEN